MDVIPGIEIHEKDGSLTKVEWKFELMKKRGRKTQAFKLPVDGFHPNSPQLTLPVLTLQTEVELVTDVTNSKLISLSTKQIRAHIKTMYKIKTNQLQSWPELTIMIVRNSL